MPSDNIKLKQDGIATEVLHEVKAQARRWLISFFIVLTLWVGTIAMLVSYLCK